MHSLCLWLHTVRVSQCESDGGHLRGIRQTDFVLWMSTLILVTACPPNLLWLFFITRAGFVVDFIAPLYKQIQPCFIRPSIDFILLHLHAPRILFCHASAQFLCDKINPKYVNSCIITHPSLVIMCCSFMRWPLEGVTLPTIICCVQKVCALKSPTL